MKSTPALPSSAVTTVVRFCLVWLLAVAQVACTTTQTIRSQPSNSASLQSELRELRPGKSIVIDLSDGRHLRGIFQSVTDTDLYTVRARYPLSSVISVRYKHHEAMESATVALVATVATVMALAALMSYAIRSSFPKDEN